ncbi:YqiA/YcfP family alpha/beta fold hydrolase [Aliikangiella maris]|uniref:YqiA/YcfP family alpha/beta fold hydrolase n=2 Tax=Aliikangiella maris TaxID=3162458 RepID=A0ABV3MJ90_9GAMM
MSGLVCFSHGKDSSPQATKINALSVVAQRHGWRTMSVDYRGIDSPEERVNKLKTQLSAPSKPLVLVGSSMGSYVSLVAAKSLNPVGLFLMAPAVNMPGYDLHGGPPENCRVQIFHGWHDDIVTVDRVLKFAQAHQIETLLLNDNHRLQSSLPQLEKFFAIFLDEIRQNIG